MMLRALLCASVLVLSAAACSSSGHGAEPSPDASTTTRPAPTNEPPAVPWAQLRNPLLTSSQYAVKDPALVYTGGAWHALFSAADRAGTWRIGLASSPDLRHWSAITTMPHDPTIAGEVSPDVVRAPDGRWVVTYQSSVHDGDMKAAKLYYRTTDDFAQFSPARPLGKELHPAAADRMIDAAVAWTPAGLLLGYKLGADEQHFELARSESGSLDGPWKLIGRPDITVLGDTIENYQFVPLGGHWRLLATSNALDRPYLFTLAGDPHSAEGWLHWSAGRELHIPQEPWNRGTGATGVTYEHANCAFVVNRAPIDGATYLVYADSPNKTTFGGEGPAVLALARSRDLMTWAVPGD